MGKGFGGAVELPAVATPPSPPAGRLLLYPKADGRWYTRNSSGVESPVGADTSAGLTLPEISTPATPASGTGVVYFKSDNQLYSKDDGGVEVRHAPITVSTTAPTTPREGDFWVDPTDGVVAAPVNFHVGPNNPGMSAPGMWVQTQTGPNAKGVTFWIEDGT